MNQHVHLPVDTKLFSQMFPVDWRLKKNTDFKHSRFRNATELGKTTILSIAQNAIMNLDNLCDSPCVNLSCFCEFCEYELYNLSANFFDLFFSILSLLTVGFQNVSQLIVTFRKKEIIPRKRRNIKGKRKSFFFSSFFCSPLTW